MAEIHHHPAAAVRIGAGHARGTHLAPASVMRSTNARRLAPTALLLAALALLAAPVQAQLIPADQPALDCAALDPRHEGGDTTGFELLAAQAWRQCLGSNLALVEEIARARLTIVDADERAKAEKALAKRFKRLGKNLEAVGSTLDIAIANVMLFGRPDIVNLLKKLLPRLVDVRAFGLRSYRETFTHVLRAMLIARNDIEKAFDDDLQLLADTPGSEDTKSGQKALKLYALALVVFADVAGREAALAAIDFSTVSEDQLAPDPDRKGLVKDVVKDIAAGVAVVQKILIKFQKAVDKALLEAVELEGTKKIVFHELPSADPNPTSPGTPITFSTRAQFPGEEWIGFLWEFGDGTQAGGNATIVFTPDARTHTVMHSYPAPGDYRVRCTVFHGFKSGFFGVGEYKFTRSATFLVRIE